MTDEAASAAVDLTMERPAPKKIATLSRKEAVREEVRRLIIVGTYRSGDKLTEAELSASLGVSRPTVREALTTLVEEGLVEKWPYRGLRIPELSPEALHDIAIARNAMDQVAIDAILADSTGRRMAILEQGWKDYEVMAAVDDPVAHHDAHLKFHHYIWKASENFMLDRFWPATAAQMTLALSEDYRRRLDPAREVRLHRQLMESFKTRDRERIRMAFAEHTITSADEIARMMRGERAAEPNS